MRGAAKVELREACRKNLGGDRMPGVNDTEIMEVAFGNKISGTEIPEVGLGDDICC